MNWRRGLVLAGIHLLVSTASFVRDEANLWQWIRSADLPHGVAHVRMVAFQEELVFGNSCDEGVYDIGPSSLGNVVATANLPIALATGWHTPCLPVVQRSWITIRMEAVFGRNSPRAEIAAATSLCVCVFTLWTFVGGFPLIQPRGWWLEPSAMITLCTMLGAAFAVVPHLIEISRIAVPVIAILWFWWFGLLIWKLAHRAWRSTLGGLRRLSN
jgi:hypothetical protein